MSAVLAAGVAVAGTGAGAVSADLLAEDSGGEASLGFLTSSSTCQSAWVTGVDKDVNTTAADGHAALQQRGTGAQEGQQYILSAQVGKQSTEHKTVQSVGRRGELWHQCQSACNEQRHICGKICLNRQNGVSGVSQGLTVSWLGENEALGGSRLASRQIFLR